MLTEAHLPHPLTCNVHVHIMYRTDNNCILCSCIPYGLQNANYNYTQELLCTYFKVKISTRDPHIKSDQCCCRHWSLLGAWRFRGAGPSTAAPTAPPLPACSSWRLHSCACRLRRCTASFSFFCAGGMEAAPGGGEGASPGGGVGASAVSDAVV